jgi:hypothetical protein
MWELYLEDRPSMRIELCDILDPEPVESLPMPCYAEPKPGSVYLEKSVTPFLPTSQFQSCLHKPADPTDEKHSPDATPLPSPREHNPVQPLGRLNLCLNKTEKHKQQIVI